MRLFLSCFCTSIFLFACIDHYQVNEIIDLSGSEDMSWNDISMVHEDLFCVVGGRTWEIGVMNKTTDGGLTWNQDSITNKMILSLDLLEDGSGCVGGIDGQIFTFENIQGPWTFSRLSGWNTIQEIISIEGGYIVASGYGFGDGFLFHLDESAQLLNELNEAGTFSAVTCFDNMFCLAVGFGNLWRSHDGGNQWEDLEIHGAFFKDVEILSENIALVCDSDGDIWRTSDGGDQWVKIKVNQSIRKKGSLIDMSFTDDKLGIVVGSKGLCMITNDGGLQWELVEDVPDIDYNAVAILHNTAILVGEKGAIIKLILL